MSRHGNELAMAPFLRASPPRPGGLRGHDGGALRGTRVSRVREVAFHRRGRRCHTTSAAALWLGLCLAVVGFVGCGGRKAGYNRANSCLTGDQLLKAYPWLTETSKHWRQEADLAAGQIPDYSHLGCFPLGNGRVFTTSGLQYPFGTMANIFGPTYQKHQGSLGRQSIVLTVRGQARDLPRQEVEWVMRAGTVHTRLSDAGGFRLDIYDCVAPSGHAIVRVIAATNDSARTLKGVDLAVAHTTGGLEARDGILVSDGSGRFVRIGFVGSRTELRDEVIAAPLPEAAQELSPTGTAAMGSTVLCPIGTLRPGESLAKIAYTIIAPTAEQAEKETERLEQVGFGLLKETHDWWQEWHSEALTITCPDERINEFIPIQQHIVRVQQAESGGYSPMYMYTTCWVRDSNGPIRFMTQSGKLEEVKRALDYFYACSAGEGRVPMNFPLDIAIKQPLPQVDWSKAPVERAEVSSFIILQHYWYWRQSGDMTPVKEHWGYLRRNLLGQQVDADGRLPFHGDETYRFPGYQIFERTQKEPTDWISMDLLSADSAWEYVAAADAMMRWAHMLGKHDEGRAYEDLGRKVRDSLDRQYWMPDRGYYAPAMSDFSGELYRYPFANINLRPQWLRDSLNRLTLNGGKARPDQSALAALKWLWNDSGTVKTTPGCGYYVGMTPGLVVWALETIGHPSLDRATEGLLSAASPSGGYAEMNRPDDTPSDDYWGKNRVRPWEGGINGEALVRALTGLEVCAVDRRVYLRPWGQPLTIRNIHCGQSVLHAKCTPTDHSLGIELQVEGEHPLQVWLGGLQWPHEVKPGEKQTVKTMRRGAYPGEIAALKPPTKTFDYGEPAFAGKAKTVVVTWDAERFREVRRADPSSAAIDTKIAFPREYLAAALYDKAGKRRADRLILDVEKYPGHCKTAAFWSEGEGKEIIDRFEQLGGKADKAENPRDKPADLFGK